MPFHPHYMRAHIIYKLKCIDITSYQYTWLKNLYISSFLSIAGPDGMRDHNVRRMNDEFTGTGERSFERTGNLSYMFRTAKDVPFPKGKHGRLGEIGGEIEIWNIKKGL